LGVLDLIPLVGSTVGGVIVALAALAAVSTTAALITVATPAHSKGAPQPST